MIPLHPAKLLLVGKSSLNIVLSQRQILGTGNLPQDPAPVCINIDISPEMAEQKPNILCHHI